MSIAENNKRIAKNTLALYFRTFITMIVGLYTGRVMLQALGVENYGINAVVGGIVGMSSLITGAMSGGISRFITFALGECDIVRMKKVFSTSVNVQIILSIVIVLVLETIGLWFLNSEANIPDGRMVAANWVLQCSILALVFNLISVPYNATIVAHEHMSIYAYMSIVDVILKLTIVFLIKAFNGDRLILLSLLNVGVSLVMRLFYAWYCNKYFDETRYDYHLFDKYLLREMTQFSAWGALGNSAWIFNTQGVNMLINMFFGVTFNAARGVAVTVSGMVTTFVGNFTVSFTPQITKCYASDDWERMFMLANRGTKFSWFLMYLLIVPVFLEAETLLKMWLGTPPEYASLFLRFTLFESLSVTIASAFFTIIQATGDIKQHQIEATLYGGLVFPLTWVVFKFGAPVWASCSIFIFIYFTIKVITFRSLKRLVNYPVSHFLRHCLAPCLVVSFASFVLPGIITYFMPSSILRFIVVVPIAILWTLFCEFYLGLDRFEKEFALTQIDKLKNKILKK